MTRLLVVVVLLLAAGPAHAGDAGDDPPAKSSSLITVHARYDDGCARLLSADLVRVDAHTLLRALARVGGVQLVIADDLADAGDVSLFVSEVTPRQAFYAVLEQLGAWAHGGANSLIVVNRVPVPIPAFADCANCLAGWLRPWPHDPGW